MPVTAKDAEIANASRSHSIALDWAGGERRISKEEVHPVCEATWRGDRVRVEMNCDRYRHSSGFSDWRIYARGARIDANEHGGGGRDVTDTARRALGEVCEPLVRDWIASDDYQASRKRALYHAILREITDAGARYGETPSDRILPTIDRYRDQLDATDAAALEEACTLLDAFAAATRRPSAA